MREILAVRDASSLALTQKPPPELAVRGSGRGEGGLAAGVCPVGQCRAARITRGSTHLRRVMYNPNGGPDGGNGGRGGHVILRGNRNYWTLLHLRYDRHVFAGNGGNGSRNKSTGSDGEDKVIEVPCGTIAYNAETGEYLCDITEHGQEVILLRGGRGGLGNYNFCTPTRQAPRFAQPGEPMQELVVILELKLLRRWVRNM